MLITKVSQMLANPLLSCEDESALYSPEIQAKIRHTCYNKFSFIRGDCSIKG